MTANGEIKSRDFSMFVGDHVAVHRVEWWSVGQRRAPTRCFVRIYGECGDETAEEYDFFEALVTLRRKFEPQGWRFGLNGARGDAYLTGMDRDQGLGSSVRTFVPGRMWRTEDWLDIFDDAPRVLVAAVDEQQAAFNRWSKSFESPRKAPS